MAHVSLGSCDLAVIVSVTDNIRKYPRNAINMITMFPERNPGGRYFHLAAGICIFFFGMPGEVFIQLADILITTGRFQLCTLFYDACQRTGVCLFT